MTTVGPLPGWHPTQVGNLYSEYYVAQLRARIAELEMQNARLLSENMRLYEKQYIDSWTSNPDRMGGSFTDQEKKFYQSWI